MARGYNEGVTYALFLALFLLLPIAILTLLLWRHLLRAHLLACGLVSCIVFVYTTPWDNYAACKRLWTFDPAFVLGPPFWLGWLPLEEYLFYVAETVFVCLVLVALSRLPAFALDLEGR